MPEILALKNIRMDKTAFSAGSIDDESDEKTEYRHAGPVIAGDGASLFRCCIV